jgi:hypothetical protein
MRERTTWSREIAKRASDKIAEDPRAMNQDHLSQQPSADQYDIGGPSEFAEDVHESTNTWKAEQKGGETARNEIGMPEFRPDTFKTAADLDEETLCKKANVCLRVAHQLLPGAKIATIEDQAAAFMHLPDVELIQTADRLAKLAQQQDQDDEEDDKDQGQQEKAQQEPKEQQKKAQQELATALQAGNLDGVQSAIDQMVQQAQQQVQQAQQQVQQAQQQVQQEQAPQVQQGGQQAQQQVQQAQQQVQQAQQQQQVTADQINQMVQQAVQQMQQGQQQPQMAQQQQLSDDQLLDQMFQDQAPMDMPESDILLEGSPMDIGDSLEPQDAILGQLFASHAEVRQAAHALALQDGVAPQAIRTASTRTVGTRPVGGVSQIGGASTAVTASKDVDKLSGLWRTAPDVSGIFNS